MKVLGMITEYNPFHNGHLYHFQKSKEICNADVSLCVMSGNFVQRGEPAIINKWARAHSALESGIDLVIELPVTYCCQSAELFALGAVKVLNSLGVVDYLVFGSEHGEIENLNRIAEILINETEEFKSTLKESLSQGIPFYAARQKAVASSLEKKYGLPSDVVDDILAQSNNILAIEYLKALKLTNSSISPLTVKRIKADYNSTELIGNIASATAIRKEIKERGVTSRLINFMPQSSLDILKFELDAGRGPIILDDFETIIFYLLRTLGAEFLRNNIMDVNEGLENRIFELAKSATSLNQLIESIKSRRYTYTRLNRIMCHTLLALNQKEIIQFKELPNPQFIRVLGFSSKGRQLLKSIKSNSMVPIITKVGSFTKNEQIQFEQLEIDIRSTDIYSLAYKDINSRLSGHDYRISPVILE